MENQCGFLHLSILSSIAIVNAGSAMHAVPHCLIYHINVSS